METERIQFVQPGLCDLEILVITADRVTKVVVQDRAPSTRKLRETPNANIFSGQTTRSPKDKNDPVVGIRTAFRRALATSARFRGEWFCDYDLSPEGKRVWSTFRRAFPLIFEK